MKQPAKPPAPAGPTPQRRRPRPGSHSAAREEAILTAAAELVVELGYEHVTTDAIAARAHASKSTMYRKWPGKAELVADALRHRAESRGTELADTGSLRGDLRLTVRNLARTLAGSDSGTGTGTATSGSNSESDSVSTAPGPSLLSLVEAIRADPLLRDVIRAQIDERSARDGALICRRAAERGENVDAARGPEIIALALAHLFLRTLLGGEPPSDVHQHTFVDEVLLPLLSPRA